MVGHNIKYYSYKEYSSLYDVLPVIIETDDGHALVDNTKKNSSYHDPRYCAAPAVS